MYFFVQISNPVRPLTGSLSGVSPPKTAGFRNKDVVEFEIYVRKTWTFLLNLFVFVTLFYGWTVPTGRRFRFIRHFRGKSQTHWYARRWIRRLMSSSLLVYRFHFTHFPWAFQLNHGSMNMEKFHSSADPIPWASNSSGFNSIVDLCELAQNVRRI